MIFRLYTVYKEHEMIKIGNQTEKNRKYYFKCSNNFAANCSDDFYSFNFLIEEKLYNLSCNF